MSISHANLFRRSNSNWYIIYHEQGKIHWKSTHTRLKHEALIVLKDFLQESESGIHSILFSEFVKEFVTLQANSLRKSTVDRIYLRAFRTFEAYCGNKQLHLYTLRDVEMLKSRRLESCSPTTVNIEFRTLRAAFNVAIKWQMLQDNPFTKSSQVRVPERLPVYFSKEDFRRFFSLVKEPVLRDLFLFAALTGLRQGEILSLKWQNVDLERRLIAVANSDSFLTKTGKCRIVPMSNAVFEMIAQRTVTKGFSESVFHSMGTALKHSFVQHKFKRYVRQSGLNDALKFHSLRHTFATWLVQGGVNIYEVQKLLGHSDIRTTEIYSHLAASELHSAVNKISAVLN
jgi:site-specific recombinase XerD